MIARNSSSSSFGPCFMSQSVFCGREADERIRPFTFSPSIQETGALENPLHMSFKQREAETGGHQLLYHGRTWGVGVWPATCWINIPCVGGEVRILPVMGGTPLEGSGAL